jgi:hypothetical protein
MLLSPWNRLNTNKMSFQNEVINTNVRRGKGELDIRGYRENFVVFFVALTGRSTR